MRYGIYDSKGYCMATFTTNAIARLEKYSKTYEIREIESKAS
jgi:hypothetical protein